MSECVVLLKEGRDKSPRLGHPWVFSGAVASVEGEPSPGEVVRVNDAEGAFVARGTYSPSSQIRLRLLSWDEGEAIDEAWWRRKLAAAVGRRRGPAAAGEDGAERLVHAEADFLPGLIVDRYGRHLVLQAQTAGIDRVKESVVGHLADILRPAGIFERSETQTRRLEGLSPAAGILAGEEPPDKLTVREDGLAFLVDPRHGQKTGFYLDQRRNRAKVAAWAAGRRVLDCFAYTGAFAVHAAAAGAASLVLVDESAPAMAAAGENLRLNGFDGLDIELAEGDAFSLLRNFRDTSRSFDMVILDPPKLAPTKAHAARASRAYKDINLLAMKLLEPEGILATFSCSGGVDRAFFREIVSWAAADAGREVQILDTFAQASDHPVRLAFPESEYLKGLLCRVI